MFCEVFAGCFFILYLNVAIMHLKCLQLRFADDICKQDDSFGAMVIVSKLFSLTNRFSEGILSPRSFLPDYSNQM